MVGVEGTGSYGAGISRRLAELGYDVVEVVRAQAREEGWRAGTRTTRPTRRGPRGTPWPARRSGAPKAGGGWVEALRFRMVARDAAVSESTRAANSAHALIVTAPAPIRGELGGMKTPALMKALSRRRRARDVVESSLWESLRSLSLSWIGAKKAAAAHEEAMREILLANAPALLDIHCCGTISAARLAVTAGTTPRG